MKGFMSQYPNFRSVGNGQSIIRLPTFMGFRGGDDGIKNPFYRQFGITSTNSREEVAEWASCLTIL
jgi:hypothetical protein